MFVLDLTNLLELVVFIIVLLFFAIIYLFIVIKNWLSNKRWKNKMKKNKEITIKIINEFEELLAENDIKIPSKEREGNEDEACIYGTTYYDLEDTILEILNNKNN